MANKTPIIGEILSNNKSLHLVIERLVSTGIMVQAMSGGGKSWLLRKLIELVANFIQVIVYDPEGEFTSLREKFDFALVGNNGEIGLSLHTAKMLGRKLIEQNIPAVINLSDFLTLEEKRQYVALSIEGIFQAPQKWWHPVVIIVDEAHKFCPQTGNTVSSVWIKTLLDSGRKRGYCGVLATQRISKLHNDAAAECGNRFFGRTILDSDQDRVLDDLGMSRKARVLLRELNPGDFFAYGPGLSENGVTLFHVGQVVTTHPKAGNAFTKVPAPSKNILNIVGQLDDLPAQVQAETDELKAAQARIVVLESQLRQIPVGPARVETVTQEVIKEVFIDRFLFLEGEPDQEMAQIIAGLENVSAIGQQLVDRWNGIKNEVAQNNRNYEAVKSGKTIRLPASPVVSVDRKPALFRSANDTVGNSVPEGVNAAQKAILDALAWLLQIGLDAPDRGIVAAVASKFYGRKMSPRSSGYSGNLTFLVREGYAVYPNGETLAITQQGQNKATLPYAMPTARAIQEAVLDMLPKPASKMLSLLIEAGPEAPMMRVTIAEFCGASAKSSGFSGNMSLLVSWGVAYYPDKDTIAATKLLFP